MKERFSADELIFVQQILHKHGEYLKRLLTRELSDRELVKTSALRDSIKVEVKKYSNGPGLALQYLSYGRAIEIDTFKKSQNSTALLAGSGNRKRLGKKGKKNNARWYAKNAYGTLNTLIGMIMYEYSDELRASIKERLAQSIQTT